MKRYQVLVSTIIFMMIVLSSSTDSITSYNVCPDRQSMEPCQCNDITNEIRCGPGFSVPMNVLYLFRDSVPLMMAAHSDDNSFYHYRHLAIENSSLEILLNNMFGRFKFDSISIRNNYYLSKLEPQLFSGPTTKSLTLNSNPNLFANDESVNNLFTIIANLVHLESLTIQNCGLPFIPKNAFAHSSHRLSKLARLDLRNNQIRQIDSNTFNSLESLRILDLSRNLINDLPANSLNLSLGEPCCDSYRCRDIHYFIDLSYNNLTDESFSPNTFNINCSIELRLTNNSIRFLKENTFRPLFRYYTMIQIYNNPLDCHHCNHSWLMKGRYCSDYNTTTCYYMVIDFVCRVEMSLYNFITNCTPYTARLNNLSLSYQSTSLLIVNKYLESYPNDFIEYNPQLLRCLSDFNFLLPTSTVHRSNFPLTLSTFFILSIIILIFAVLVAYLINRPCT
ncbi:hypothetical protein DERP_004983 [Dermatophagoides pteronyssinus]|uniref:Uncharacterized protein n=1 Tax=Dermatophagoides pteronyssinus TaxID=6956 RepID=A0ABQ8JT14_DERPT|nr:hypothetical protein DERP_004983 [Dermatophagoides pteronyssinus]